jgi:hypothetical protein
MQRFFETVGEVISNVATAISTIEIKSVVDGAVSK